MSESGKNIVLGISGSIAAYKAADLTSQLVKAGHTVNVVMTKDAQEFITPLTLQVLSKKPVTSDLFDEKESWRPSHIQLADEADLFVVAPASANVVAQFAHGLAGDALSTIALAIGPRAPWLIAPAMNGHMWNNPATQENVEKLKSRGANFIDPEDGMLACGYEGVGRLWEVEGIVEKSQQLLGASIAT